MIPLPLVITGSSGRIGSALMEHLADLEPRGVDLAHGHDLSDVEVARQAVAGCRSLVHLAANPDEFSEWDELRQPNVDAVVHVLGAAAEAGVQRVVFASSVHASGDWRPGGPETPPRPGNLYGATKAFGEAVVRMHADRGDFGGVCLRIGWYRDDVAGVAGLPPEARPRAVTARDLAQLVRRALDSDVPFLIAYGVSGIDGCPYDIAEARAVLGYAPRDGRPAPGD